MSMDFDTPQSVDNLVCDGLRPFRYWQAKHLAEDIVGVLAKCGADFVTEVEADDMRQGAPAIGVKPCAGSARFDKSRVAKDVHH
jgi:hypothetical protein